MRSDEVCVLSTMSCCITTDRVSGFAGVRKSRAMKSGLSVSSRMLVAGCQEQQSECCFIKFHLGRVNNSHFYKLKAFSFKLISQFS